jgi:hypothetical protein
MSKVEQIGQEIAALTAKELAAFRKWYEEFDSAAWDRQIEADAAAGKLDAVAEAALAAYRAGKTANRARAT